MTNSALAPVKKRGDTPLRPWLLELPAPKPGSQYPEGFEHAQIVVNEDLLAFTQRHPPLDRDLSASAKPINADVQLRFADLSVKFHWWSLAEVIQ